MRRTWLISTPGASLTRGIGGSVRGPLLTAVASPPSPFRRLAASAGRVGGSSTPAAAAPPDCSSALRPVPLPLALAPPLLLPPLLPPPGGLKRPACMLQTNWGGVWSCEQIGAGDFELAGSWAGSFVLSGDVIGWSLMLRLYLTPGRQPWRASRVIWRVESRALPHARVEAPPPALQHR